MPVPNHFDMDGPNDPSEQTKISQQEHSQQLEDPPNPNTTVCVAFEHFAEAVGMSLEHYETTLKICEITQPGEEFAAQLFLTLHVKYVILNILSSEKANAPWEPSEHLCVGTKHHFMVLIIAPPAKITWTRLSEVFSDSEV
ncbi:hypothetical protein CROQUDRAFT_96730 [Cronartium quercuum f. sp. fusiforme G11]|uniref:Uncharacterized protein n=1 Tax=Cronartium quercuum f. sp. fusiforme G11 TaxID=708437 RepID=A0A9P6T8F5_9BASI|nr:hypothetical protein CROQUDRAFT_96730 [Cronartium quercuum f. sp. fusiforme G11]